MLYSDIERATLSHIYQYSVTGVPVASSYNNQADYLNRIPLYINEALVNIRTLVKPEPVIFPLENGEAYGGMIRYELPDNFWSLRTGGVSVIRGGRYEPTNEYKLQGKKYILVPADAEGTYSVEYYRYPEQLPLDAKDSYELDEDLEVIQAATYYAAANLVLQEDEFLYASLYNEYETRMGRISRGIAVEVSTVQDAYGFTGGEWA